MFPRKTCWYLRLKHLVSAAGCALPQNKCPARSGFSVDVNVSPLFQADLIGTGPFRGMEPMAALSSPFKGWRYQVLQGDIRSKGGPGPPLGATRNDRTGGQLLSILAFR